MNIQHRISPELLVPYLIYEYVIESPPSTKTYDDRLLWQKVGYISQELGMPLDKYNFKWYLAGPYSSAYTSTLFNISNEKDHINNIKFQFTLNELVQNKLNVIKKMISNKPANISLTRWLELIASILYLGKKYKLSKNNVIIKLKRHKPHFSNDRNNNLAWELLKKVNLL